MQRSEQQKADWRDRGTVVREPKGPGRARVRALLRDPRKRIEGEGENAHRSAFTKRPLGARRRERRAARKAARAQRQG